MTFVVLTETEVYRFGTRKDAERQEKFCHEVLNLNTWIYSVLTGVVA